MLLFTKDTLYAVSKWESALSVNDDNNSNVISSYGSSSSHAVKVIEVQRFESTLENRIQMASIGGNDKSKEWLETAIEVARDGSQIFWEGWNEMKNTDMISIGTKINALDLVTEYDKRVEELIFTSLMEKYPDHKFIGEEAASEGKKTELTDDPTWVIDPIDGTMNFVHRFPHSAICIGLMVNKEVEAGVVYHVAEDKMYSARRGHGAFCNKEKLEVSQQAELSTALVCTEFGPKREREILHVLFKNIISVQTLSHGMRMTGSAALNMCLVASGGADAYFDFGLHVWDMAASSLILREAGGFLLDPTGGPHDLMSRQVVCAGTLSLAEQVCKVIKPIHYERDG